MPHTRDHIVRLARHWIGTPYHHQASVRGVGTDCVGLIRGLYRELYGIEAETPPPYARDWAEASGKQTLLEAARRHLIEIPRTDARPGDTVYVPKSAMAKMAPFVPRVGLGLYLNPFDP